MRCNEKILPPFPPPTGFQPVPGTTPQPPPQGGGGGGNEKPPRREDPSFNAKPNPGHATPLQVSALGPGPARRAVVRTGGRAGAEHLHANTDGERRAGRERALHHHDRLRGHRGCRGGGRLPAPPLQPGARNDRRPEPRGQGHVPPEQRREQQRQTHDSARRRVHRHRRRGHEDTAG